DEQTLKEAHERVLSLTSKFPLYNK
ncbi:hypothetical protein L6B42_14875, partial [Staphylococcus aureus]